MGEGVQLAVVLLAVLASAAYLLRGWWRSRCLRVSASGIDGRASAKSAACGGCGGGCGNATRAPATIGNARRNV